VASASAGSPCGKLPGGFYASWTFTAGQTRYALTIAISSYAGPQVYAAPPGRVTLRAVDANPPILYTGTAGRVAINSDERSGTINESLSEQTGQVRVSGTWSC
jgi:hypothetical protein